MSKELRDVRACPECKGVMRLYASNEIWAVYVCEICDARLMTHTLIKEKLQRVRVGQTEIYVNDEEVASLLKREYRK